MRVCERVCVMAHVCIIKTLSERGINNFKGFRNNLTHGGLNRLSGAMKLLGMMNSVMRLSQGNANIPCAHILLYLCGIVALMK